MVVDEAIGDELVAETRLARVARTEDDDAIVLHGVIYGL